MKKLLIITLSVLAAAGVSAQRSEMPVVVDGVERLVITTGKNHPTSRERSECVKEKSWDVEYPFASCDGGDKCCKFVTGIKDLYWGWNFNYGTKGNVKNCFEVGVANVIGLSLPTCKRGPTVNVGLGFGMRRYLARDGYRFDRMKNVLLVEPVVPGFEVDKSRVDSWTFHVPVMITQNIYKKLAISAGAWLNFNTYVKGETQYYVDNIRYKEHYKGFNQRFFTVDVVAVIGIKNGIGFYGRWSPMSLFDNGYGPEFKSASMGVMLNF